jgi:quinolinate synthase
MRHLLKNINLTNNRQNLAGEGDGCESIVENTVDDVSRQLDSDQRESIRSDHSVYRKARHALDNPSA